MYKYLLFFSILILLISCSQKECEEFPEVQKVDIKLNSLEKDFGKLKTKSEIQQFLNQHKGLKNGFLMGLQYPDSFIVDYLYRVNTSPAADTLYKECETIYGDFSIWKNQFQEAFSLLKYYFPDEEIRTINTFIPGLSRDLHVDDTSVFIGIDYFLGERATFRPQNYQYILKRYRPEAIAPMTMMYVSGKYNESDLGSNTLLSEMIFFGKAYYFTKKMLPCVQDSLIVGFSSEEFEGSEKHIKTIWAHFVENELLYITKEREKQRYVGERPKVTEIGNKCPGRIGQFLGWKIVDAFMTENPNVSLAELMSIKDAKIIFEKSKFKP